MYIGSVFVLGDAFSSKCYSLKRYQTNCNGLITFGRKGTVFRPTGTKPLQQTKPGQYTASRMLQSTLLAVYEQAQGNTANFMVTDR